MLTATDPYEANTSNTDETKYSGGNDVCITSDSEQTLFDSNYGVECTVPRDSSSGSDDIDDFYDAAETEFLNFDSFTAGERAFSTRRGARCPILGVGLHHSGEQLYAPYLQRAIPLTDDVIAERRLMMFGQNTNGVASGNHINMWQRLEVAHRLLKPKLLSDMQCFKAANPGATFHDFVTWYGNPTNPLSEDEEDVIPTTAEQRPGDSGNIVDSTRAMDLTRDFWFTTWEEANPIPAIEQGPLFDAESTVEMALDYLENIHPASLLCQVMAVNLCSSYFAIIASTGEALLIGIVSETLLQLRDKIESALFLLSVDATRATGSIGKHFGSRNDSKSRNQSMAADKSSQSDAIMMVSVDALAATSAACEALGQAEVIVSRAASLLYKLDKQYDLIERILREREGTPIVVADHSAQQLLLTCIHKCQNEIPAMIVTGVANKILPARREYMLQNMDNDNPCQLCVRYNDEGIKVINNDSTANGQQVDMGGMILALAMTTNDIS
jgi:Rab3 GTPase-activating protein catalytic subunit